MTDRDRRWYEGKYGRPPPIDPSVEGTEKRLKKAGLWTDKPKAKSINPEGWIKASRRYIMKEKAPKTVDQEQEKYICPKCLEETLCYDNDVGLFVCSNTKDCGKKFALIDVTDRNL